MVKMAAVEFVNAARLSFAVLAAWLSIGAATTDSSVATTAPDIDKICANTACRTGGYEAVVGVDADHFTMIPVTHSPYILDDGSILIFPGESIAVQFSMDGDKLGPPISAKRYAPHLPALIVKSGGAPEINADDAALPLINGKTPADEVSSLPPNTLLVSYGQFKPRGQAGMNLTVESNLAVTIKLDAIVAEISSGAYHQHYTSTCPIMPKLAGYEMWPNALGPIILRNFRVQPTDTASVTCS
jgi:hypothetical protein